MKKSFWTIGVIVILLVVASAIYSWKYINDKAATDNKSRQNESSQTEQKPKDYGSEPTNEVSKSEAEKIALDKYGGSIKNTEDDLYHGTPTWEVEVRDSSKGRIEVKVDKTTGKILHVEGD